MRSVHSNGYVSCIKKYLYKVLKINVVFDSEDQEYITLATCINEKGRIETINIEDFEIQGDINNLENAFIEIEEDDSEDLKGFIFKNNE